MKYILALFAVFTCFQGFAQVTDSLPDSAFQIFHYDAGVLIYRKASPYSSLYISALEITPKNVGQEPSFLLSETPSITAYSDAGSQNGYSYFRIRGIDQTRINMTLDGVPLNEPEDQGVYFSNYPDFFNSIGEINLQRGVSSSQNGTASFGGSIQFSTPKLSDTSATTFGVGYGSYNTYRAFGEYNSGIKNNKGVYVRASHLHSDGYKDRSAHTSQSVFFSTGLFGSKTNWKLTGFAGHQQNEMAWLGVSQQQIDEDPRTNANSQEDDEFTQGLIQLQNFKEIGKSGKLKSAIFYNYLKGNYDFDFNNFLGLPSTEELYNYAVESHFAGFFSNYTWFFSKGRWTTGVYGHSYSRVHTGSEKSLGQLYQNTGVKPEASAFTKARINIGDFCLFGDIQYRYTQFNYKEAPDLEGLNWNFINPKFGITLQPRMIPEFYYSIGKTSREPTRTDLFGGSDELLIDSLGNPILFITDPEQVIDQELGITVNKGKWNANLNLYYMDFKNEIVLNGQFGPNGLALNSKVENSFRTGIELALNYKVGKHFKLVNNSSFNYSKITDQNITFTPILTPPVIVNQEVQFQKNGWTAALSGRYQSGSYIDFANENKINDYVLVNARVGYKWKKWQYRIFMNNLTNAQYFNNGYVDFDGTPKYFVQAPVNGYAAVEFSF